MGIKPSELRIGNYFYPTTFKSGIKLPSTSTPMRVGAINALMQIEVIEYNRSHNYVIHCSDIEPIPISNEWLLRLGFPNEDSTREAMHYADLFLERRGDKLFLTIPGRDDEAKELFYVHEVQNIYHALTREELEVVTPEVIS